MKIFLAAPLFNNAERGFNSEITRVLREKGFEVWFAQEAPFSKATPRNKKRVYENIISELKASDVVVAVLDGMEVDAGVAYEVGYAKALGKSVVGLKTDIRTFSKSQEVNLMLEGSLSRICKSVDELIDLLSRIW